MQRKYEKMQPTIVKEDEYKGRQRKSRSRTSMSSRSRSPSAYHKRHKIDRRSIISEEYTRKKSTSDERKSRNKSRRNTRPRLNRSRSKGTQIRSR